MVVESIIAGMYEENCYLLIDDKTKECGIIDPGGNAKKIENEIISKGLKAKFILITHGHADHVDGVEELSKALNIPFYISKVDEEYMSQDNFVYGSIPKASGYLKEGDTLTLGNHTIKVIETPGHTKGGLCFLVDDLLFTGDTLFQGAVGRTDFIGGDMHELISSIKTKLLPLGDNIKVFPGHGPSSTIGFEKVRNPYL
ncbi:MBL fold metallo-hydrolase [Clostridium sp. SM-530-WT-3G]|uniref:MBL fold metallo-hydrolase n=1 Tax=Clostridium sp. SM-530-WT-3G TaxID=2725303 RepID=UPI00145DD131|nr:MBL fold metallo-hydrolase [Clostridium sp. SM-530-WT-3G]NME82483.1 MBL fold metallo-hydrolase [Clostridium sp. SM-530-WT-3G]